MTDAQTLEVLTRGAAVGGFFGLAMAVARGGLSPARMTGILFCFGAAAHTLTQMPAIVSALGWAVVPVWIFSVPGAGLFWAFATELFEDRDRFAIYRFAPAAMLLAIGIAAVASPSHFARYFWLAHNILGVALAAHVLFVVATGWRNDLVESRRRLRGPLLVAGATYAIAVTAAETGAIFWQPAQRLSPLAAVFLLALSVAAMAAFLRADADLFGPARETGRPAPSRQMRELETIDGAAAAVLDRLMREERLYREPGLTISSLALRLGLPEHRLRQLINRNLGHRNFNAFLNQWRIDEAKGALTDPAQRAVPISTIALDAGFQSLGPFNRAFKTATGLTPTEFRAQGPAAAANDRPVPAEAAI